MVLEVMNSRETLPQKRVKATRLDKRGLKTARSAPRTHHKSVARIPNTMIKMKPKEARRKAERLATLDP